MMRPQSALHYTASLERISEDLVSLLHSARGEEGEVEDVLELVFRGALESITSVFLDNDGPSAAAGLGTTITRSQTTKHMLRFRHHRLLKTAPKKSCET